MVVQVASGVSFDRLRYATVLVAIGEVFDAESELHAHLEEKPGDVTALGLLAKVKHLRGELSEAVALWMQIHALSSRAVPASFRLASMLHMVRDPEGGAGEFLALANHQLWKKPKPLLELEQAFRLFLARKPDEAAALCEQIAQRHRGKDPDVYKLASLARAWVAELAGDPAGARAALQRMGQERGFEEDADRLLALARVCEQIGGAEQLEKAVQIHEFLSRGNPRVSTAGQLAVLHRALGRAPEAQRAEERFEEAFRRLMHLPSFGDLTAVASERYVPLARLSEARVAPAPPDLEWEPRRRAVAFALAGEGGAARALLAEGGAPEDLAYLADLALAEGDRAGARELYLRSVSTGWLDLRVVGWLLEELGETRSPRVAAWLASGGAAERVHALLSRSLREAPLRPSTWRQCAALAAARGDAAEERRCAERARTAAEAAERRAAAVGRVCAAAVYHLVGGAKGLIHELWAERRPARPGQGGQLEEVLGNATPELAAAVRNTFVSVREYALARLPHLALGVADFNYALKITKEDEASGGLSGGLPTALAFLSVFLQCPVPHDVAATGILVADAHDVLVVRAVGEIEQKVRGACNRDLRALLVPAANRRDLEQSRLVPRAAWERVARFVASLDQAVELVFGSDIWTR